VEVFQAVLNGRTIAVVLPAYNAELTLARTVAGIDRAIVDKLLLVDDASTDETVRVARSLHLSEVICHDANRGYGANQKTCYNAALTSGADVVIMVHPDYQYSPRLVVGMAAMIAYGEYDCVLGSRVLAQNAVSNGMPRYKYVANRALTLVENLLVGAKLSEYHTGLRAYSRALLERVPFDLNSDDFVFDNQFLVQALAAGARIGELSCPARYAGDASSISFRRSVIYGVGVMRVALEYAARRWSWREYPYLDVLPMSRRAAPNSTDSEPAELPSKLSA
jgi:glycosyltransferase involved in cell wall biosynthesis